MACLVSITLIAPLRAFLTSTKKSFVAGHLCDLYSYGLKKFCSTYYKRGWKRQLSDTGKETHQLEYALGRISSTSTVTTALGPCSSKKCIASANRSWLHFPRYLSLTPFRNLDVDYSSNRVITGYWVGPDIDDGWGFVEAIIDRMT